MSIERGSIADVKVMTDKNMVDTKRIKRSFLERLFSLHWFTRYKVIFVPLQQVIQTDDALIMHPDVWKKIQIQLEKERNENV